MKTDRTVALVAKQAIFDAVFLDATKAGAACGVRPLFLKGIWADGVLFGATGERLRGDVDILVSPNDFFRFAQALVDIGYVYSPESTHRATGRWGAKEWGFRKGQLPPIDLHWGLADEPWFHWAAEGVVGRAIEYASPYGPMLSLCPNDQVLYASAHYANHRYQLDLVHFFDVVSLLNRFPVDWNEIRRSAREGGLTMPLWIFEEALRGFGIPGIPDEADLGLANRLRAYALGRWVAPGTLRRRAEAGWHLDKFVRLPLLSSRPSAFVEFAARAAVLEGLDRFFRLFPQAQWDRPPFETKQSH